MVALPRPGAAEPGAAIAPPDLIELARIKRAAAVIVEPDLIELARIELARKASYLGSQRAERTALSVFAVLAVAAIIWIIRPVGAGFLIGTLVAFSLQGFYERLAKRTGRSSLTALGIVIASALGLLAAIGGLSLLFITRGMVIAHSLIEGLAPGGALRELAREHSSRLAPLHLQPDEVASKLRDATADLASRAASMAGAVATVGIDLLLTMFFAIMTLAFILPRWPAIALRVEEMLPLRPRYTRSLLEELHRVGRTTLLGTVVTGLAQGAFAAVGFWITGVPEAAFFGAATAVASLIPGVGTLLVWVPAGIFLIATGHPGMGILELCWGTVVVVGVSDYIIRPRLVGAHGSMPALLTFAALFGGVEVFGLAGLLMAPLIMSVSFALLRIFAKDAEERRVLGERHA
jgi:predicted PurR-regulated permease PerM